MQSAAWVGSESSPEGSFESPKTAKKIRKRKIGGIRSALEGGEGE